MAQIIEKLKSIPNLYHAKGCSTSQIKAAQDILGIIFPDEFVDYVKQFGAISFYGTEWTGLNVDGYLNVVEATLQERKFNTSFPNDCIVLENLGIDGLLTVMNAEGEIFSIHYDKRDKVCGSLVEYVDVCKSRKK